MAGQQLARVVVQDRKALTLRRRIEAVLQINLPPALGRIGDVRGADVFRTVD